MTMIEAEKLTGLTMRDLQRVASDQDESGTKIVTPDDPQMRYQLGELRPERRIMREQPGVCDAMDETVTTFRLMAFGATPEQAVSRYRQSL